MFRRITPFLITLVFCTTRAEAITGNSLVLKSNGAASGSGWVLQDNGYVGTYIDVPTAGNVSIAVAASGQSFGGISPLMNVVVGDSSASFTVGSEASTYEHGFFLPAGKHFIRTELANDPGRTSRSLTVSDLSVVGASINNVNSDANALAAADNHIEHYRKGVANVRLIGAAPGSPVQVKLRNHAFNFGANFPGSGGTTYLGNTGFTSFFADHFNAVVPSNGGKWSVNEPSDQLINMSYADAIRAFAQDNGLRLRMHTLAWGTQNPGFIQDLINQAASGNTTARNQLRTQISQRIDYYVGDGDTDPNDGDRATHYFALDVLNEHVHQGQYFDAFSPSELAGIFNETHDATVAAGADVDLFLNEYNVLQNGPDNYGNWYREGADDIVNAGGQVDGLGVQYYAIGSASPTQPHSAARIHQTLQGLSVGGFDLTLTEFGIQGGTSASATEAADILEDSLRLFFGTAQVDGFFHWGFWEGGTNFNLQADGILVDQNFNLTEAGQRFEALMNAWDTDVTLNVAADGTIDFNGFYGDYEIIVDGVAYELALTKGVTDYQLIVSNGSIPGDLDGDGFVGINDLNIVLGAWNQNVTPGDAMMGDPTGDGFVGIDDLDTVLGNWNTGTPPSVSTNIPEPSCLVVLGVVCPWVLLKRFQALPESRVI